MDGLVEMRAMVENDEHLLERLDAASDAIHACLNEADDFILR